MSATIEVNIFFSFMMMNTSIKVQIFWTSPEYIVTVEMMVNNTSGLSIYVWQEVIPLLVYSKAVILIWVHHM